MGQHRFTRQELYDLVWSEPMEKVAPRFGIAGRGLAKACARANVPVPSRGYWAQREAGKAGPPTPLPRPSPETHDIVEISPPGPKPEPEQPAPLSDEARVAIEEEKGRPKIVVPQNPAKAHPFVRAWLEQERQQRATWGRLRGPDRADPARKTIEDRRLRILSALFRALETRNYLVKAGSMGWRDMSATFKEDVIPFELTERIRQYRMTLTEDERAKSWSASQRWTQVREPTGELLIRIGHRWRRSEWSDEPGRPLEDRLNEVMVGFAMARQELRQERRQKAEEERRRWEKERERQRRLDEERREQARVDDLLAQVASWRRAADLCAFVAAVRDAAANRRFKIEGLTVDEWALWALAQANRLDPLMQSVPEEQAPDEDAEDAEDIGEV
jgi:hypothetical protein